MPFVTVSIGWERGRRLDSESNRIVSYRIVIVTNFNLCSDSDNFHGVVYLSNEIYIYVIWSRLDTRLESKQLIVRSGSGIHYCIRIRIIPWTVKFLFVLAVHDRPGFFYHILSSGSWCIIYHATVLLLLLSCKKKEGRSYNPFFLSFRRK
jgi:hypothetical protein